MNQIRKQIEDYFDGNVILSAVCDSSDWRQVRDQVREPVQDQVENRITGLLWEQIYESAEEWLWMITSAI